jgi:hypothetical protein
MQTSIALAGYAADNQHEIVVWQNTVGPWRNVQKLIPAAADGTLTRAEYDAAVKEDGSVAARLPFASVDTDADGVVTAADMARLIRPRLDAILKAVDEGNDDFIWQAVVNLSSAYLRDGWDSERNYATLLKLNVPLACPFRRRSRLPPTSYGSADGPLSRSSALPSP